MINSVSNRVPDTHVVISERASRLPWRPVFKLSYSVYKCQLFCKSPCTDHCIWGGQSWRVIHIPTLSQQTVSSPVSLNTCRIAFDLNGEDISLWGQVFHRFKQAQPCWLWRSYAKRHWQQICLRDCTCWDFDLGRTPKADLPPVCRISALVMTLSQKS